MSDGHLGIIYSINFDSTQSKTFNSPKIVEYMKVVLAAGDYFTQIIASYRANGGDTTNAPVANDKALSLQTMLPQFIGQIEICVPAVRVLLKSRTFKNLVQVHDSWQSSQAHDFWLSKIFNFGIFSHLNNWISSLAPGLK